MWRRVKYRDNGKLFSNLYSGLVCCARLDQSRKCRYSSLRANLKASVFSSKFHEDWKNALLSIPVHVRVFTMHELYFETISIREEIAGDYDAAYFTAFQRVYMIKAFEQTEKAVKGDQTYEQLAASFKQARMAAQSEAIDVAFIETALGLHRRVLSIPSIAAAVKKSDEDYSHRGPFAKLGALQGIMKKASTPEQIEWVVLSIDDLFRNGMMALGECTWDALTGYRSPGHKGTVDLLICKKDMLLFFTDRFAAKHSFDPVFLSTLRNVLRDHQTYRLKVPGPASRGVLEMWVFCKSVGGPLHWCGLDFNGPRLWTPKGCPPKIKGSPAYLPKTHISRIQTASGTAG